MSNPSELEAHISAIQAEILNAKISSLQNIVEKFSERNYFLQSNSFPQYEERSRQDFATPTEDQINNYYLAQRRLDLAKNKNERLKLAKDKLRTRIKSVQALLMRQYQQKTTKSLSIFCPTAYQLLSHPEFSEFPTRSTFQSQEPESVVLEKQIRAIRALNDGEIPQPMGLIPFTIKLNEKIASQESKLQRAQADVQRATQLLKRSLENFLRETPLKDFSIPKRQLSESWSKFHSAYTESGKFLTNYPIQAMEEFINNTEYNTMKDRIQKLSISLENERQLIQEQLRARGISDPEMIKLRDELQFKIIYLEHLTASAGKALSKISTQKEPIDPLIRMETEIIEMDIKKAQQ